MPTTCQPRIPTQLIAHRSASSQRTSLVTVSIGAVSIYIVVLAIISFLSLLGLREMTQADISGEAPVVPSAVEADSTNLPNIPATQA